MEISGTFTVDVTGLQLKADKKNDGQEACVDCNLTLTPETAVKQFGEAFAHVAFACMREQVEEHEDGDETVTRFGYSTKKPPKWLRPSVHNMDLWGVKQKGQPEIRKITAGDNVQQVIVALRFTIDANEDEGIIGKLGALVGKTGKVKIKPMRAVAFPARRPAKGNGTEKALSQAS